MYYTCSSFFWDFAKFPRIFCPFPSPSSGIVITGQAGEIWRRVVVYDRGQKRSQVKNSELGAILAT